MFDKIPVSGYLGMAYFIDLNQFKGNNSCITEASRVKLNMYQCLIAIHIYFSSYLVIAYFIDVKSIQVQ